MTPRLLSASRRSFRHDDRGTAALELGLLLPVLALLLAGVVDLGRALWQHQVVVKSSRDAVRFLTRAPTPWASPSDQTQADNLARTGSLNGDTPALAEGIAASFSYPTVSGAAGYSGSDRLVVGVVSVDFTPLTGFGLLPSVVLRAAHTERHIGE